MKFSSLERHKVLSLIFSLFYCCMRFRDEVLTRNKFLEEEARRKAEAVENGEIDFPAPQMQPTQQKQDAPMPTQPKPTAADISHEDDDIFYDSDLEQPEE